MPVHISRYADKLRCTHCGNVQQAREWPLRGDQTALYFQDDPGRYGIKLHFPQCGRDWYVAWDDDPGPIMPLDAYVN
jgi:hypothetical protein